MANTPTIPECLKQELRGMGADIVNLNLVVFNSKCAPRKEVLERKGFILKASCFGKTWYKYSP